MVHDDDDDDEFDDHLVDADDVPRELRRWSLVRRIHRRSGNRRNLQFVVDYASQYGGTLMVEAKKREIGKILTYGANFSELVLSLGILVLILGVSVLILGVLIFFYPGRKSFGAYIHACSMFFLWRLLLMLSYLIVKVHGVGDVVTELACIQFIMTDSLQRICKIEQNNFLSF